MKLLKGAKIADQILTEVKKVIQKNKIKPGLAVVMIGRNDASEIYIKLKKKAAQKVGILFRMIKFSGKADQNQIIAAIKNLNNNPKIHGIIVQLPLPAKFDAQKIINAIDPQKDADGFHPKNIKYFLAGKTKIYPVFPQAIVRLLKSSKVKLKNKKAVIIANSYEFGEIMQVALKYEKIKAEYVLFKDIKNNKKISQADIAITAIGKPNFVKGDMLKKDVTIIDGGIAKKGNIIMGDVDVKSVKLVAFMLSPVPGGVGPVTIACLLQNVSLLSNEKKLNYTFI